MGQQGLSVSVDVSALQVRSSGLVGHVEQALVGSGLPPRLLELELTESVLLEDAAETTETLKRLRALGVRLAIDDFGKGDSSLSYLRHLAVDKLKIDRGFVGAIDTDPDSAAISLSIVKLA